MGELLFRKKYRVPSARLPGWDYSAGGFYFVTICTQKMECILGGIYNNIMCLNRLGSITHQCWQNIPNHFPHVSLDEFIIMPNHVHGILEICENKKCGFDVETQNFYRQPVETLRRNVSTYMKTKNQFMSSISPKSGSLSTIVRSYKSAVTKIIDQQYLQTNFQWQPRFYDRIIRNERELYYVREYIKNNSAKWWRDRNNQPAIFV